MAIRPLPTELQRKAENELNEVPHRVQKDLDHIKEWLSKQPHLKARTDDQWLITFLRGCKYSLERTKEKLNSFYTARTLIPEFFSNRDPLLPEIQEMLKSGLLIILPKTATPDGPRLSMLRAGKGDPNTVSFLTYLKVSFMIQDILSLEDDNYVVAGQRQLQDLKNFSFKYAAQFSPVYIRNTQMCLLHCYPVRLKGLCLLNTPAFFETTFNLIRSLLPEKLQKRVCMYNSLEDCCKEFPPSVLPKDYGGEGPSCDELAAELKRKVESYRDWFLDDAQYSSDESKRIGGSTDYNITFGAEGSFRKLDID